MRDGSSAAHTNIIADISCRGTLATTTKVMLKCVVFILVRLQYYEDFTVHEISFRRISVILYLISGNYCNCSIIYESY